MVAGGSEDKATRRNERRRGGRGGWGWLVVEDGGGGGIVLSCRAPGGASAGFQPSSTSAGAIAGRRSALAATRRGSFTHSVFQP